MNFLAWSGNGAAGTVASGLVERLALASLELAALALAVWVLIHMARVRRPRLVALLWALVLLKPLASLMMGSFVPLISLDATPAMSRSEGTAPAGAMAFAGFAAPVTFQPDRSQAGSSLGARTPGAGATTRVTTSASQGPSLSKTIASSTWIDWVKRLWGVGVALFVGIIGFDWFRMQRLIRRAASPDRALSQQLETVADTLGMSDPPPAKVTDDLESPALAGVLRPVILMPTWLLESADGEKINWALRHELMHWKLRDPWANALRQITRTLFFFHPVAWWAGRHWEEAAERACDRALVRSPREATHYSELLYGMLVQVQGRRRLALGGGLFAARSQISRRITALLNHDGLRASARLGGVSRFGFLLLAGAVLLTGIGVNRIASGGPEDDAAAVIDQERAEAAATLTSAGWKLWRNRDLKEAEATFRAALEKDAGFTEAWNGLGWSLFNQGEAEEAKEAFDRCLALNPKHPAALNGLGWIAYGAGDRDTAIERWLAAVEANPGATASLNGLVKAYLEIESYDQAEKYLMQWLGLEPSNAQAQNLAAQWEQKSGRKLDYVAPVAPSAAPTDKDEPAMGRERDEAIERGDLLAAVDAEMGRVLLRAANGHPYKDKIDLTGIYEGYREKHRPNAEQVVSLMEGVVAYGERQHGVEHGWRVNHLLATMALDLGDARWAATHLDHALQTYPDVQYSNPTNHSKFQHLINERAGLVWDSDGVAAAESYALDQFRTNPKFDHFYDGWWRERYEETGQLDRLTDLRRRVESIRASKPSGE